jgi:prophage tail gpP-like protein
MRRRERTEKDTADSRARAEVLAMEVKEHKQEAYLLGQRMQRIDTTAKEQKVSAAPCRVFCLLHVLQSLA